MNKKNCLTLAIALLFLSSIHAQEKAFDIVAGAVYPIQTSAKSASTKPKTGLTFGLLYRKKNEKGEQWSAGAEYQLLQSKSKVLLNNVEETQTEKFEMFHLRGCPVVWLLGKKKQVFVEAGVFVDYLLHEETELKRDLINNTKVLQRTSAGPSLGLGVQLGQSLRKSIIFGLRDDFGAVSFGKKPNGSKAKPLKFNTISLYVGLGI
jgi:hypothetical protein